MSFCMTERTEGLGAWQTKEYFPVEKGKENSQILLNIRHLFCAFVNNIMYPFCLHFIFWRSYSFTKWYTFFSFFSTSARVFCFILYTASEELWLNLELLRHISVMYYYRESHPVVEMIYLSLTVRIKFWDLFQHYSDTVESGRRQMNHSWKKFFLNHEVAKFTSSSLGAASAFWP